MRPGDFSPGNEVVRLGLGFFEGASMRPGDFSPGNVLAPLHDVSLGPGGASMRPGDFSPGNFTVETIIVSRHQGFNEAGGFLPRKHVRETFLGASDPALQ